MSKTKPPIGASWSVLLILLFGGSLLAFTGWARASEPDGSIDADVRVEEKAPALGVTGSQDAAREARQRRKALRRARRDEFRDYVERIRLEKQGAAQNQAAPAGGSLPAAVLTDIKVSFKLDPRLTQSLYMGERWVSPATYAGVQEGEFTVEARVQGLDASGRRVDIRPEWIPADPEMVTVSPSQGNEVAITVHRAGQSSLHVASQDVSRTLSIKAAYQGAAIQVEISQTP